MYHQRAPKAPHSGQRQTPPRVDCDRRKTNAPPEPPAPAPGEHPLKSWEDRVRWNLGYQLTNRRAFAFVLLAFWVSVLWAGIIYKHASSSFVDIFEYYTNVVLFLQGIFYTTYLFVFAEDPRQRRLERALLIGFWWPVFAQILLVFIMVHAVLLDAPELVTQEMKSLGGPYDDGLVLVANSLVHYVPVVVAFVFLFTVRIDVTDCLVLAFGYFSVPVSPPKEDCASGADEYVRKSECECGKVAPRVKVRKRTAWIYAFSQYALACCPFLAYMTIVDLTEQYGVSESLAVWPPIVAVFALSVFIVLLPLAFFFCCTVPKWTPRYGTLPDDPGAWGALLVADESLAAGSPDHPASLRLYVARAPWITVLPQ